MTLLGDDHERYDTLCLPYAHVLNKWVCPSADSATRHLPALRLRQSKHTLALPSKTLRNMSKASLRR